MPGTTAPDGPTVVVRRRRLPGWTAISIPLTFVGALIVLKLVVHPWTAHLLFTTWGLPGVGVYVVVYVSAVVGVMAWFAVGQRLFASPEYRVKRTYVWAAGVATVPGALLVWLPTKGYGRPWAEQLTADLGYELGHAIATAGGTVLFALMPTAALFAYLVWWASKHPRWVALGYLAMLGWAVAVGMLGWTLGRP